MLAPRPWGLSLLKIRRHKHLLDDLILVLVLCVPHDFDDFVGRVLRLADASLGLGRVFFLILVLHFYLRGAGPRIGTRSGRTLGAIATEIVTFPSHVTSASSGIEKGKWLEWRDAPSRTDSSGSNGPVEPDLVLDAEESFIIGRLVSADGIEHEDDHAPDYGAYGVISGRLALS
jgi:hypothetical protein